MSRPLMLQDADDKRIEQLKLKFGIHKKIDVVRAGLQLLEQEAERVQKIKRWQRAAKLVTKSSREVNKDFRSNSTIHKDI